MELFTLIFSSLLTLLSPIGFFVDHFANNVIRSRFTRVEQLQVRVDNSPNYQLIQGKLDRVRIAGRGFWLTPDTRLAVLELDTDPIEFDIQRLRQHSQQPLLSALRKPLQTGVRFILTEADLNKALQSPAVSAQLRQLGSSLLGNASGGDFKRYEFTNPKVEFLENNRLRLEVQLRELGEGESDPNHSKQLNIKIESGVKVISGHQLQLVSPEVVINDNPIPSLILDPLTDKINEQLDLNKLQKAGMTARLLKLEVNQNQMEIAAFIRVEPTSPSRTSPK